MTVTTPAIVTISYQDLVDFKRYDQPTAAEDDDKSKLLMEQIGRAYGSDGSGILAVSGVPGFSELRENLLPMAAQISKLPEDDLALCVDEESCYSVGWSHGKEELTPGVPDLAKGSFYSNPLVNDLCQAMLERRSKQQQEKDEGTNDDDEYEQKLRSLAKENPGVFAPNRFPPSMPHLEGAIFDMGQCIASVGRLVSRVADAYCEQQGVKANLEKILTESLNCKARLLHYFDTQEQPTKEAADKDQWWCGWHNDHGSLTGLVPAMYLRGETQLSAAPDPKAGLYIQSRSKELVKVGLPSDCIGFQIGETFQILSGGLLQATPHAVKQALAPGVTRETYAVFMEPEFEFPLTIPANRTLADCCPPNAANQALKLNSIQSRWKPGMTFGAFHNVTVQTFHKQLDVEES